MTIQQWYAWNGGEMPVPSYALVDVIFRGERKPMGARTAAVYKWDIIEGPRAIIAFWIVSL